MIKEIRHYLTEKSNPQKAIFLTNYFRAKHYGLGDTFLGLAVPQVRTISKKVGEIPFSNLCLLINSRIHEERLLAVINLITQFQKTKILDRKKLMFEFYMKEMLVGIDNWDLVDIGADKLVGVYLIDKPELKEYWLYKKLAISTNLWQRRIAMIATQHFIKNNHFTDTFRLAELFLNDKEEIVQKACGWMLREIGKKQESLLLSFLEKNYKKCQE